MDIAYGKARKGYQIPIRSTSATLMRPVGSESTAGGGFVVSFNHGDRIHIVRLWLLRNPVGHGAA
jgi:hypothetical protein